MGSKSVTITSSFADLQIIMMVRTPLLQFLLGFSHQNFLLILPVLDGCKMVCDNKPCKNNGLCLEDFTSRTYSCDCVYTSYHGKTCDEGKPLLTARFPEMYNIYFLFLFTHRARSKFSR